LYLHCLDQNAQPYSTYEYFFFLTKETYMLYEMNTFSDTEYYINTVFDGNSRFTETVNCYHE
jgi:hypothetical protein